MNAAELKEVLRDERLALGLRLLWLEDRTAAGEPMGRAEMESALHAAGKFVQWTIEEAARAEGLQRRIWELEAGQGLLALAVAEGSGGRSQESDFTTSEPTTKHP